MKKKIIVVASIVLVLVIGIFLAWQFWLKDIFGGNTDSDGNKVYVESVETLTSGGSLGLTNRFSGVVEPQKEIKVNKDSDKKVEKVHVTEGQTVKKGEVLFSYDTEDMTLNLEQAKLEVEGIDNSISLLKSNIEDMEKQKNSATDQQKIEISLQIQSAQLDIKNKEYERASKQTEAEKLEKSLNNADVVSEIDGIIKSVNNGTDDGTNKPFISILSAGNYRVKATATELNIYNLSVGQRVIIRSRVDERLWQGQIETIDVQNAVEDSSSNMYYYSGDSSSNKATKYNFYIELDDTGELMLGQHVYVELDYGQTEVKEGLWLPNYYIGDLETTPYDWIKNDKDKLEKRTIEIGAIDEDTYTTEVLSGLSSEDFIAMPLDYYENGMGTTTDYSLANAGNMEGGMAVAQEYTGEENFQYEGEGVMAEEYQGDMEIVQDNEENLTGEAVTLE